MSVVIQVENLSKYDRLGLIGGGTLLKILSRITAATTGRIKIKGRVGSLLEVGTGFHPEFTSSQG